MTRCFFTKRNGAMLFIITLLMMMLGSFTPVFAAEGTIGDNSLTLGTSDTPFYSVTETVNGKSHYRCINTVTFSGAAVKSFDFTRGSDGIPERIDVVFADTTDSNASIKMTYIGGTTNIYLSNDSDLADKKDKASWVKDTSKHKEGYNLTLTNGKYNGSLYLYAFIPAASQDVHPITVNFTTDTSDEADADTVTGIEITTPPDKTEYAVGEIFNSGGMVVTATMGDGTSEQIKGYTIEPDGPLTLSNDKVTIKYGNCTKEVAIKVNPRTTIQKVEVLNGQLLTSYFKENDILPPKIKEKDYNAVIWYGEKAGKFEISVDQGATLTVGDKNLSPSKSEDEQDIYTVELTTKEGKAEEFSGERTNITVENGKGDSTTYRFTCFSQVFAGMPNKVIEHICAGSQYTNGVFNLYGLNAVSTLRGAHFSTGVGFDYEGGESTLVGPASVGNFGSYITYYYEDAIKDDPKNPYGVDFIVSGNSVDATDEFAEPGQVWVSENGEDWYALAGSAHYENSCIWNHSVTYSGKGLPSKKFYPLYPWTEENEKEMTLSGIFLDNSGTVNNYGNTLPIHTEFGYVDVYQIGINKQTAYVDNVSLNPYLNTIDKLDGFDLAWAVDENGQPFDVSTLKDGIHYVKIQTATNIVNDAIGEKSTEVCAMAKAESADKNVGVTAAPTAVKIEGKSVTFGENNVAEEVGVHGAFAVNVTTDAANVYIGNTRTKSRAYPGMPEHKMLRIIVQDGEKAPWIGNITLKEDTSLPAGTASTITFDPDTTLIGKTTGIYTSDMTEAEKVFPSLEREGFIFQGWYDEAGNQYEKYEDGMPATLTLKARWKLAAGTDPEVKVSFRLIGATKASEDKPVDLSKGEEGYHGVKYQTWIATKEYTLPAGSTVIDLVKMATKAAGIKITNPDGNYIEEITAPESCGGYKLGQFTNGTKSGWMYTINGKHGNLGVAQQELKQGDNVILHYVNDYTYEVSDWDDIGGSGSSSAKDDTFFDRWLEAEDKNPEDINPDQPGVDKTDLKAAIEKAEALTAKDYTVDSWKALADALTKAKAVQADKDAAQKEVDAATKALTEATKALVKKPAKEMTFTDVQEGDWFYEGVKYAYEQELVKGVSADQFAPNAFLTRAQCVTILYRSVGEPEVKENAGFTDVKSDSFAKDAINWATKVGVIQGRSDTVFDPDAPISREELAMVLHRFYVKPLTKTMALSDGEDLSSFTDYNQISPYALEAMTWTVENGYIQGMPGKTLEPKGKANRAQFVTIMMRTGKDQLKPAV